MACDPLPGPTLIGVLRVASTCAGFGYVVSCQLALDRALLHVIPFGDWWPEVEFQAGPAAA